MSTEESGQACSSCGAPLRGDLRFCVACGAPVAPATSSPTQSEADERAQDPTTCRGCGSPLDAAESYCGACGRRVEAPQTGARTSEPHLPSKSERDDPTPPTHSGAQATPPKSWARRHAVPIAIVTLIGGIALIGLASWAGGSGDTDAESRVETVPLSGPPAAPTITARSQASGALEIEVEAPASDAASITDYVIEYAPKAGPWVEFEHSPSRSSLFVISNLEVNRSYRVRVAAVNAMGTGSWSTVERVRLERACSTDDLRDLVDDYISLGNRTVSAYNAWPDVLDSGTAARRILIRYGRESKQAVKVIDSCGAVNADSGNLQSRVDAALAGEDLVTAVRALNKANGRFWAFVARYLRTGEGSEERFDVLAAAADDAVERFNATWAAYGDEVGFEIDKTPDPPIDESKEPD